ncbi:beta strand repeat-containing protein [Haloferula rosea]|uniref:Autotransporter-associated beta strand repeat-containing protein n=1 Tax=Haloferula rosea TaxID=490093 RepID=A0A934R9M7_9BACT|nr:autotransporter-associated beta strand repeat-containing protein [Haloferula rosea]MBK1826553.1 autotransporter-associated beta strand repeat-containing protein [Haloferula rosea]
MSRHHSPLRVLLLSAVPMGTCLAVDILKDDNATDLNVGGSWVGGTAPGSGDVAVWDSTVTGTSTTSLGANLGWVGLRIEDPAGDVTIQGSNSLTIGSSGLDTGATANLTYSSSGTITLNGSLAGSTSFTIDNAATKNWSGMSATNFTGTLTLRGGSGSSGSFAGNWLAFGSSSVSQTGAFHLDTGASLADRGDFIVTDGWGDGTTKPKLALASLTGFGDFRSDWGSNTFRTVAVDQATDTTFQGRLVSSNASRGIDLEKLGTGTLTLTGNNAHRNTTVSGGILQVGNGGTTGSLGGGLVSIESGGELRFNRSNTIGLTGIEFIGPGTLSLRGGSAASGSYSGNWISFTNTDTGGFHLDTGASLSDRGEIVFGDQWGDGTTKPKFSISSLSGYGDFRSDLGSTGNRTISADQSVNTEFQGRINQFNDSTRSVHLEKLGAGTLTLSGANNYQNTIIGGGTLEIGNGGTTGEIGFGTVSIASGATLRFNRSDLIDYNASARMRDVSGAGNIVIDGGGTFYNYTGAGLGFNEAGSWSGLSGNLTVRGGSEFQTIRNGATAMGTGTVILGDATSSGTLSQIQGNWTWTNDIEVIGADNTIANNSTGSDRSLKLQGDISGTGGLTFSDTTGAMNNLDNGFVLTGTNTMTSFTIESGALVRVGGVGGNSASLSAGTDGSIGSASVTNHGTLTFSRSDTHSLSASIGGSGNVRIGSTGISGSETQQVTFSTTHTYTGTTEVNAGTLYVTGALANTSSVAVANGATLGGTGSIAGATTINSGGTLAPGTSVGTLTIDNELGINSGGLLLFEINSLASFDRLIGLTDFTMDGILGLDLNGYNPSEGDSFDLVDWVSGTPSGSFTLDDSLAPLDPGLSWDTSSFLSTGSVAVIPEPRASLLLILGVALLIHRRR